MSVVLLVLAASVAASADPVTACRAAHADDPAAHIACLEAALRREEPRQSAPPELSGLGSDRLEAREQERGGKRENVPEFVQVVAVEYDMRERGIFRTSEGQVWRQTEVSPRSKRLSTQGTYSARIERGKFGGYRMHIEGVRGMLKVERLE